MVLLKVLINLKEVRVLHDDSLAASYLNLPAGILLVQNEQWKYLNNVSNLFKNGNKDTRSTSFWCRY